MPVATIAGRLTKSFRVRDLKADFEKREITGYAATWDADQVGDIIEKGAFERTLKHRGPSSGKNRIKLLWQHKYPIGKPVEMFEDEKGLFVRAKISKTALGDEALTLVEDEVVDQMSIGYEVVRKERDNEKSLTVLKEIKLFEFSLVTFPANEKAVVLDVKSQDHIVQEIVKLATEKIDSIIKSRMESVEVTELETSNSDPIVIGDVDLSKLKEQVESLLASVASEDPPAEEEESKKAEDTQMETKAGKEMETKKLHPRLGDVCARLHSVAYSLSEGSWMEEGNFLPDEETSSAAMEVLSEVMASIQKLNGGGSKEETAEVETKENVDEEEKPSSSDDTKSDPGQPDASEEVSEEESQPSNTEESKAVESGSESDDAADMSGLDEFLKEFTQEVSKELENLSSSKEDSEDKGDELELVLDKITNLGDLKVGRSISNRNRERIEGAIEALQALVGTEETPAEVTVEAEDSGDKGESEVASDSPQKSGDSGDHSLDDWLGDFSSL